MHLLALLVHKWKHMYVWLLVCFWFLWTRGARFFLAEVYCFVIPCCLQLFPESIHIQTEFHTSLHIKFHISGGLGLILHAVQALASTADIAQLLAVALLHISENIMLTLNYSFPTACMFVWLCVCVWERERPFRSSQPAQSFRALQTINKLLYIFPFRKTYLLTLNISTICFPSNSGKRRGEGRRRRENNLPQFPLTLSLSGKMETGLFARTSMPNSNWYYTHVRLQDNYNLK